jgi:hypothetical protein
MRPAWNPPDKYGIYTNDSTHKPEYPWFEGFISISAYQILNARIVVECEPALLTTDWKK